MSMIAARLERLPFAGVHRQLLLMGGLGYTFDGMDGAIVAFVLPALSSLWALTSVEIGVLASANFIGYLVGAFCAGNFGDLIGRRRVMMWALAIFCLASLVTAFATSWPMFSGGVSRPGRHRRRICHRRALPLRVCGQPVPGEIYRRAGGFFLVWVSWRRDFRAPAGSGRAVGLAGRDRGHGHAHCHALVVAARAAGIAALAGNSRANPGSRSYCHQLRTSH